MTDKKIKYKEVEILPNQNTIEKIFMSVIHKKYSGILFKEMF